MAASTPPRVDAADLEFPWFLPLATTLCALLLGAEGIRSRASEWGAESLWLAVPVTIVALVPWVADLMAHRSQRFFLPRLPWAAITIAAVTTLLVDSPTENDFVPFFLVLLGIQGASTATTAEVVVITVAAVGTLAGLELANQGDSSLIWIVGTLGGVGGGIAVRMSVEMLALERMRTAERVARASGDERQRIAREVHDVVAHSLSVTMLHLTGARHALESGGDPAVVAAALRDAERLGREAMNDIRRTVGLLAPDDAAETAPMPGASDIPALVDEFARAGLEVTCDVRGDVGALPVAMGLGVYRIAQESLANVAKHAPGSAARLTLDLRPDHVSLVVENRPVPTRALGERVANGGLGLRGMQERARLLGGTLVAGPRDAAWVVSLDAPVIDDEPARDGAPPADDAGAGSDPGARRGAHRCG